MHNVKSYIDYRDTAKVIEDISVIEYILKTFIVFFEFFLNREKGYNFEKYRCN